MPSEDENDLLKTLNSLDIGVVVVNQNLCIEFINHGFGKILNDPTLPILGKMAVAQAKAGGGPVPLSKRSSHRVRSNMRSFPVRFRKPRKLQPQRMLTTR